MFGRKDPRDSSPSSDSDDHIRDRRSSSRTLHDNDAAIRYEPSKAQIKRATRTRLCWALISAFFLLVTVVFLILVEIGSIRVNPTLTAIYFLRLDLSNIIPLSVPNASLINSIAQTIGLHDYYTVGLWTFCEGNNGEGFTDCSTPKTLYWFNPLQIIKSELLSGATIALPFKINSVLGLIRTASHWMFGLFLTGVCLSFVMIFISPLAVLSRWPTLVIMLLTFFAALCTTVASVIATVMFIIMKDAVTSQHSLNIGASIGVEMFAFMWVASGAAIVAWLIQLCLTCCCASRRDVRRGRKRGSKKAWENEKHADAAEGKPRRGWFGRSKA